MRQAGEITRWQDDRGFGFIAPTSGGPQVFVHISALPHGRRPVGGEAVTFVTITDDRNRLRATEVEFVDGRTAKPVVPSLPPAAAAIGIGVAGLLAYLAIAGLLPRLAVVVMLVMSVAAFVLYRADKSAAIRGAWRVRESTLHLVSLLGGWPGALLAQRVYRHKTRKPQFRLVFWLTVGLNCAAMAWWMIGLTP